MGPEEVASLKSVLTDNHRYAWWCAEAVFFGLIAEYLVLFWGAKKSWKERLLIGLFAVMVAGGVGGEAWFGDKAGTAALDLQNESERVVADSNARTKEAEARVLEATARIAEATRQTEEARLALALYKKQHDPRTLSEEQLRDLVAKLTPFGNREINLFANVDPDSKGTRDKLLPVFAESGWQVHASEGLELGREVHGIAIEVRADADEPAKSAAGALATALRDQELFVMGPSVGSTTGFCPGPIFGEGPKEVPIKLVIGRWP